MPVLAVHLLHVLSVELFDVLVKYRPVAVLEVTLVLLVGEERLRVLSLHVALINAERSLYHLAFLQELKETLYNLYGVRITCRQGWDF